MSVSNKMKTVWCRAAEGRFLLLMLCVSLALGPRAYAQPHTSRTIPETHLRLGMLQQPLITCPVSTLRSAGSSIIEPRMFHIFPDPAA
jgi:hypothetical protein